MEEGTIIEPQANTPQANQNPAYPPQPPTSPISNPASHPFPLPSAPQPPQPTPSPAPPPPGIDTGESFFSRFPFKKLLKILGVFLIILTVLFIFLTFISNKVSTPSSGKATITYWGLWEDESIMAPIISEFEAKNPNITVEYKKQDPKDYRDRLNVRIQNGTGPDIFRFHNTWYPMLSGILLPLPKDTVEKKFFQDNFYNVAQKDLIKNGAIYGIPLEMDTLSLFVNDSIFDQASSAQNETVAVPTTWQEFIDTSAKLTTRDDTGKIDVAGAAIGTYENVNHAPDIISLLFAQNGVNLNDIQTSNQKVIDALQFYTNFALIENNVWDQTLDPSVLAFSKGKLAMMFGYSWDYFSVKTLNPSLSFRVVAVPQLLKDSNVNLASYWAEGVSAKSKHQKEALLFMKYLAQPETAQKIYTEESKSRLFGEPYGNKNLAGELKDSENFVFVDQAKTAVSSPFVDSTYDNGLNDKLDAYLKDAVNGILTGTSVDSAVSTLLQGYSQVISQYAAPSSN